MLWELGIEIYTIEKEDNFFFLSFYATSPGKESTEKPVL